MENNNNAKDKTLRHYISGAEITKEKNLWQVFKLAKKITTSFLHRVICSLSAALLFINVFFVDKNINHAISDIRSWSSFGFNFTITTLGFLIAGFTIFATLSKPEMMIAMMLHKNKEAQIPTLKYNFMAFMKVFIIFISCSFIYLFVMLFGQTNGMAGNITRLLPHSDLIKKYGVMAIYVLVGTSLVHLLLTIKTFIYNIYAIVMTSIRWEYEKSAQSEINEQEKK